MFFVTVQLSFGQSEKPNSENFDTFLQEVYIGKNAKEVNPSTRKYSYLKELFTNRIEYKKIDSKTTEEKIHPYLSTFNLMSGYNPNLKRYKKFNPKTFNPFKYNIPLYKKSTVVVAVDNTDYIIIIHPQTSTYKKNK